METKEENNQAKGVKKPKKRNLEVTVKAHELYHLPSTEGNTDNMTELSDDERHRSPFGQSKKNYKTTVFKGYDITWKIKVEDKNGQDKGYEVELISISRNPTPSTNPNFFDHDPLVPDCNKKSITGTITNIPSPSDLEEIYTINFQITYKGVSHCFPLDPKLKMNPA